MSAEIPESVKKIVSFVEDYRARERITRLCEVMGLGAAADVRPFDRGETLTVKRVQEVLIAAAEEFLVDRLNWAGGGNFQAIVSRWLIHNAEQVEHGQVATDEQHGAMALANAYLRYRQTVSPARGDDQGAKEEVGQENSGSLGDCPRCGSVITEAKAHVEKVETEPSGGGLFRQFVPGAMELVLSPCKCRFWGSEAAVLGAELRHRRVGRVTTRDTPEGQA